MRSSRLAGVLVAFLVAGVRLSGRVGRAGPRRREGEVTGLLLRAGPINTSNPPGNEAAGRGAAALAARAARLPDRR